jgi:hypothetical protein
MSGAQIGGARARCARKIKMALQRNKVIAKRSLR